jgi:methylase of polypeptide subunit release factors
VTHWPPPPPSASDRSALAELRTALERADYTVEQVEATLGVGELSTQAADVAVHRLRLADEDAFSTFARLFLLGLEIERDRLHHVLGGRTVECAVRLGLAARSGESVRATVRLVPHGDYYLASDLAGSSPLGSSADWVPGVQAPSVTLAQLAVRRGVARALDLGTGCGIQALLAAKHSELVIATDVNPRALAFAAFNAALNDVGGVELRRGDGFAPVEAERFGLLVSNPPYVISPDSSFLYRDSGLRGDEICRRLVRGAPAVLEEGGFAHLLVAWVHDPDGDWFDPLRRWVEGSGCDAWLLHYKSEDPVTHAANWLSPLASSAPEAYTASLGRWVDHLRELGIEAIGYGAVVLRRRSGGSNWVRVDEIPFDRLETASAHTLRVFAAADFLAGLDDESGLLEERLVLVERHRLEQTASLHDGALVVESQMLELTEGLGFRAGLDRYAAAVVARLGSPRPLGEVLAETAAELQLSEADRDRYVEAALDVVKRLFELGLVVRLD